MTPDIDDNYIYTSPETELEVSLNGADFLVLATATEERFRVSGLRTEVTYLLDLSKTVVYPVAPGTDYYGDEPLPADQVEAWLTNYGGAEKLAREVIRLNERDE